jgi:hypothetical protein
VLGVDERGESRFRCVVPFAGCGFASSVLGGGDDFEILGSLIV